MKQKLIKIGKKLIRIGQIRKINQDRHKQKLTKINMDIETISLRILFLYISIIIH